MSSEIKKEKGLIYLKCKQCENFKELNHDLWYKHNEGFMGVLGRCKQCIKGGRKTEHELSMARKRDSYRYYNNPNRRSYVISSSIDRRKEKGYAEIHSACYRIIKKLGIRPTVCPICKLKHSRIESHHYNYQHPFKIIFCCKLCHSKLDRGIIDYQKCDIIDIEPTTYKSKVKGIDHKINRTGSCY